MFRNIVIAMTLVTSTTVNAEDKPVFTPTTGGWIEFFIEFNRADALNGGDVLASPALDMGLTHSFTEQWGVQAVAVVADRFGESFPWSELYVGPTWTPCEYASILLLAGMQTGSAGFEPRYAGVLTMQAWVWSFTGWVEWDHNGTDGVWYDVKTGFTSLLWLNVGLHARRFVGFGPRVDITIPFTPITIWATYAPVDGEEGINPDRAMTGVVLGF